MIGQMHARSRRPQPGDLDADRKPLVSVGFISLSIAFGILIVSIVYTAARHGYSESALADDLYLVGQAFIVIPAALRLLSRRGMTDVAAVAVTFMLAAAQYITKVLYSPLYLSYSDELSHWLTAENILSTGKLFTTNNSLPISPQYPGLEEATVALVQITGISLFPAALIVAGVAHVILLVGIYVIFRNVAGTPRIAGIAILLYSTSPGLGYFDSIFSYQSLAMALLAVALLAVLRLTTARSRTNRHSWALVAVIVSAATVMTHHVTSYMLIGLLLTPAVVGALMRNRRVAVGAGVLAAVTIAMVVAWISLAARQTVGYLEPPLTGLVNGFAKIVAGGATGGSAASTPNKVPASPHLYIILEGASVLLVSALVAVGLLLLRRNIRGHAWRAAFFLGSLGWFAILGVRVAVPDGSELSGRAAAFVLIPASFAAAIALYRLLDLSPRHEGGILASGFSGAAIPGASLIGVVILAIGGIISSWPPFWEWLPGPHQVAGVERSVGPQEIAAAEWMQDYLGPGNRVASDMGFAPVLSTYGDQIPILDDGFLYMSSKYTPAIQNEVDVQDVHYVMTDMRLTTALPAGGTYWPIDHAVSAYTHPLPSIYLTKFEQIPGVSRIFDDGEISIYDLQGGHLWLARRPSSGCQWPRQCCPSSWPHFTRPRRSEQPLPSCCWPASRTSGPKSSSVVGSRPSRLRSWVPP